MTRPVLIVALGLMLGACSEPGSTNIPPASALESEREAEMSGPKEKQLKGWGPFTFGMNFDDALTAYPGLMWDAASVLKCRTEMPLRGCTLDPAQGSRVSLTASVSLLPTPIFNQDGKISSIRLQKFFKGDVKRARCMRAYGQLSEYLREIWGAPKVSSSNELERPVHRTPQEIEIVPVTGDRTLIGRQAFHVQPDGRKIILQSRYIVATDLGTAVCHLSIEYRGPKSLQPPPEERPHPLRNWY